MQLSVGQDVVTMCGKCKERTYHVVFAMDGDIVKRVQCKVCLSYHNYHPDKPVKGSGTKRRSTASGTGSSASSRGRTRASRAKAPVEPDWETLWAEAIKGKQPSDMVDYHPSRSFAVDSLLNHAMFGVGVVTEVSAEKRMKVLFQQGQKTLAHSR